MDRDGAAACGDVVAHAENEGTSVHSYVTINKALTFCIYDGPSPEAIRTAAEKNGLPADGVTEAGMLDPTSITEG
jgi:hypothetical protein